MFCNNIICLFINLLLVKIIFLFEQIFFVLHFYMEIELSSSVLPQSWGLWRFVILMCKYEFWRAVEDTKKNKAQIHTLVIPLGF